MFDPKQFLEMSVDQANATEFVPIPAGDYVAVIDSVDARPWQAKDDPSKAGMALDVVWSLDDAGVKELLGRDVVKVKQGIMLDFTEEGALDMGKGRNVGLGRLREAVGLNEPGRPFAPQMLVGRPAKVKVEHRADPKDPAKLYAEVRAVTKM